VRRDIGFIRQAVEEMLDVGSLSKWEYSFLIAIADKLDRGQSLSEREFEKLDEIIEVQ
jgi:hypothetical protein